ncbi:MAG TPA: 6-hydroxymethylpterin diphosphokinase MptE-like protein [Vicinamibacterales bacterium]|nr:6-hydroxymethylpterin diphosphokinase MptE-like protein [Vicinamibacterales bacterium]
MTDSAGGLGRAIAATLEGVTLHKVREAGFRNAELNAAQIRSGRNILELRASPLADGEAALVIGAGPSLHRHDVAAVLKAIPSRVTLIATESAMAYCFRNDIVPDLVVTLDPHAERIVRWFGDPSLTAERLAQDDYFARQDMDPAFAQNQLRFNGELLAMVNRHGPSVRAAVASSASPAVAKRVAESGMTAYWWNPFYDDYDLPDSLTRKIHDMNGLPCLNAGGNVGSAAWVIAHAVLGKRHVALAGIDFGYYPDTPYERTQYYYELIELVGRDRLDEVFVRIPNPHLGIEFYTDPAYLWYRDAFLQMAAEADCRTYNCSGGGILFGDSIIHESLEAFLTRYSN